MILADTSVWVDHLRAPNPVFAEALNREPLYRHLLIVAELSMASLPKREETLSMLDRLVKTPSPSVSEVRKFGELNALYSRGIGFIDATLLASCRLLPTTRLWTRDKRLSKCAQEFGIAYQPLHQTRQT